MPGGRSLRSIHLYNSNLKLYSSCQEERPTLLPLGFGHGRPTLAASSRHSAWTVASRSSR
eukprot:4646116-Amphidinium_carterae.1